MAEPTVKATWRLPADLHRRIEALARRSRRSMNQQVVYLLESHPEVVEMETKRQFRVDPMHDPCGLVEPDYSAGVAGATKAIYLALDTRDGSVWLGTRAQADNAVPMEVWHGIVRRYYLPANVDAQRLTQDINSGAFDDLLRRIVEGSEVVWDGNNHVCRMTDDAMMADGELERLLRDYPHVHGGAWDAGDWLYEAYESGDLGLTAQTSDEELDRLAQQYDDEARESGICLLDTRETLRRWRDELRERAADADEAAIETINLLLVRRREMGALTSQEQQDLASAFRAMEGRLIWQAWLYESDDAPWGEGATEEEAIEAAVAAYEREIGYGSGDGQYPDRDALVAALSLGVRSGKLPAS